MKETQAIIERVRRVNTDYVHLDLAVDEDVLKIKPGQSLLVRAAGHTTETWHPYLREQWYPVSMTGSRLLIERPALTHYEPGSIVSVLGPVGQYFRFRRTLRSVLLLAYGTAPTPLLLTVPFLLGNQVAVTLVLLGSARAYPTQHLPPEVEVVRGEPSPENDLVWANQVLTIGWADQVFAVVGQDDEHGRMQQVWALFKQKRADVPKNYLFAVYNTALPCGVGACGACAVQGHGVQGVHKLVCTEGPAFDMTLLEFKS